MNGKRLPYARWASQSTLQNNKQPKSEANGPVPPRRKGATKLPDLLPTLDDVQSSKASSSRMPTLQLQEGKQQETKPKAGTSSVAQYDSPDIQATSESTMAGLMKVLTSETFRFCARIHQKDFELPSDFPRLLHQNVDSQQKCDRKRRIPPEAPGEDAETDRRCIADVKTSVAHAGSSSGAGKHVLRRTDHGCFNNNDKKSKRHHRAQDVEGESDRRREASGNPAALQCGNSCGSGKDEESCGPSRQVQNRKADVHRKVGNGPAALLYDNSHGFEQDEDRLLMSPLKYAWLFLKRPKFEQSDFCVPVDLLSPRFPKQREFSVPVDLLVCKQKP